MLVSLCVCLTTGMFDRQALVLVKHRADSILFVFGPELEPASWYAVCMLLQGYRC